MRNVFRLAVLSCLVLSLCACAAKTSPEPRAYAKGQFVLPDGTPLADAAVLNMTRNARYVLVGERHNSPDDHALQARYLDMAAQNGQIVAVGLEMLPRGRFSKTLTDFSAGRLPLEKLPQSLRWKEVWGYDFALYEKVFAAAKKHTLPLYGLNMPGELRAAVSRKGLQGLSPKQKAQLPAAIIPPPESQREALASIFLMHTAMRHKAQGKTAPRPARLDESGRPVLPVEIKGSKQGKTTRATLPVSLSKPYERFLLVQSLWDSTMAEEAVAVHKKTGKNVTLLTGAGHAQKGWGIAHRLATLDPNARIVTIMPFSSKTPDPKAADIFYYNPSQDASGGQRGGFAPPLESPPPGG